jgi:hypothetical protein
VNKQQYRIAITIHAQNIIPRLEVYDYDTYSRIICRTLRAYTAAVLFFGALLTIEPESIYTDGEGYRFDVRTPDQHAKQLPRFLLKGEL